MRNSGVKEGTVNEREIFSHVFREGRGLSGLRAHEQPAETNCKLPFLSFARLSRRQKGLKLLWKRMLGRLGNVTS